MIFSWAILAVTIVAQPLTNADVLEPSVENEVAHALSRVPAVVVPCTNAVTVAEFAKANPTNGVTLTDRAIRLVSSQRADGRWLCGTNDVTSLAVSALREMLPCGDTAD